ncbi:MAG: hypothetical protein H8K04_00200 [Nitrospira sp.]
MNPVHIDLAVHWSARLSALLFAMALALPALTTRLSRHATALYLAFMIAHTVHFGFVVWMAHVTDGANMFPGGRSVEDVGGWPTVFAIFALFYALAFVGLAARRVGSEAGHTLRRASRVTTTCVGLLFVVTYVGLLPQSLWYAVPGVLVAIGMIIEAFAITVRPPHCLRCAVQGGAA